LQTNLQVLDFGDIVEREIQVLQILQLVNVFNLANDVVLQVQDLEPLANGAHNVDLLEVELQVTPQPRTVPQKFIHRAKENRKFNDSKRRTWCRLSSSSSERLPVVVHAILSNVDWETSGTRKAGPEPTIVVLTLFENEVLRNERHRLPPRKWRKRMERERSEREREREREREKERERCFPILSFLSRCLLPRQFFPFRAL
jgi:hypothetical protein